jgi:hypothetical protein
LRVGRDRSVYGVADRTATLTGFQVHLAYFGDPWESDLHQEKITRFWRLFFSAQGGTLVTFSSDIATAFKNARLPEDQLPRPVVSELDPTQSKLEMLRVTRDVALHDWITRDNVLSSSLTPSTRVGPMKIGIRWQGNWDLDLYASASPGAETLFFHHTRCPEGYYYKDHRASPGREYEFIEFTSPVRVFEVEAMVNFYKGVAPNEVTGEVRVEFDHKIYTGVFRIPANEGNEGRLQASQSDYWARIDLPTLLHLSSPQRAEAPVHNGERR